MFRHTRQRTLVIAAAVAPIVAAVSVVRGGGNWDGEEIAPVRAWFNPINWDLDSAPVAAIDPIVFGTNGDGVVDLGGGIQDHPSITFNDWTTYTLSSGTIQLGGSAPNSITVNASVPGGIPGSVFYIDGTRIDADVDIVGGGASIDFAHAETGVLYLGGNITGAAPLTINRLLPTGFTRPVFVASPNAGFTGNVNINAGTLVRLMDAGRIGSGLISLVGGQVEIVSDTGAQVHVNPIASVNGSYFANHNFTANPLPVYSPITTTHMIGPVTLDNPSNVPVPGFGINDASISFGGNNNYSFISPLLNLANAQVPPAPGGTRFVRVQNGYRTDGQRGSIRLTNSNRQQEQVVTTTFGGPGPAPGLMDYDPVSGLGLTLIKYGTGVLAIDGDNTQYAPGIGSSGMKYASEGVIRFNNPLAYGGPVGLPSSVSVYSGVPGPISAGIGVGYDPFGPVPANLFTFGTAPGQSGTYCIDAPFYGSAFAPGIISSTAPFAMTAWRLGSSGTGVMGGVVMPFDDPATLTSTYFLGGGGGTLSITGAWAAPGFPGANIEMGTSGNLLPGRVNIAAPLPFGPPLGAMNIRAGTLDASPAFVLAALTGTSVGTYSMSLDAGGNYTGAPAATPFNGPGQLLLDAATHAGFGYFYGPGGGFGAAGVMLDGGAIGWAPTLGPLPPIIPIGAPPGTYGMTVASTVYQSLGTPLAPVATNVLHLGGEQSMGTMDLLFSVTDNGPTPVVLMKSGADSILNLRPAVTHFHTGGTAIVGGEVQVDADMQLGGPAGGAVVINDGGILHVMGSAPPVAPFSQVLRVANGVGGRSGRVDVDFGITAQFNVRHLEAATPGSILEKTGFGVLELLPPTISSSAFEKNTWGIKASQGVVIINQLPRGLAPGTVTGSAIFTPGGDMRMVGNGDAGFIAIPNGIKHNPNYGFGGLQTYEGLGVLNLGVESFFRITGKQTSNLTGVLLVNMASQSVFKVAGDALADDTRGTGVVVFGGPGFVQFTPGGGNILWPRDTGFRMDITNDASFAGCPDADFNGELWLDNANFDAATVSNFPATAAPSIWTIGGTGNTNWIGVVNKGSTEAIPGAGGPFVSGTVNINRNLGAQVYVSPVPGVILNINAGVVNAGGTGDPFTDTSDPTRHLPINNNASFNITQGHKHVKSIAGGGTTTVAAGAILDVGSSGPVTQGNFTVNGSADVGNVNVSGTTSVGAAPAYLTAHYVRGGTLSIGSGDVVIKPNGGVGGISIVTALSIAAGGHLDLTDNDMIINYTGASPAAAIEALVASAYNVTGDWLGDGITSSIAAGDSNYAVGIADNAALSSPFGTAQGGPLFSGIDVDLTSVLVKFTHRVDLNLDGLVTDDDAIIFSTNYEVGNSATWSIGDLNYDGVFSDDDAIIFSTYYDTGLAQLPEPASVFLIALLGAGLGRRQRCS